MEVGTWRPFFIGLDANILIVGFIVFLVKIMQLNFARFYLTRIYLVLKDTSWIVLLAFTMQVVFAFAFNLAGNISSKSE